MAKAFTAELAESAEMKAKKSGFKSEKSVVKTERQELRWALNPSQLLPFSLCFFVFVVKLCLGSVFSAGSAVNLLSASRRRVR